MRNRPASVLLALLVVGIAATPACAEIRVVAYVPNWIDLKAFAATIEYQKLTHINIAFENPINDAGDLSFNEKDTALISKARENHVKVLVSIGGGSASTDKTLKARYFALMSEPKRAAFAAKIAAYLSKHDFDGLDVDIEGPSINQDYGGLIGELGKVMRAKGKLLTAAVSEGYGGEHIPDAALGEFDFVSIMAYDGTGPWDPKGPGQHSSMEYAKSNVAYWLKRGVSKSKAVLGVPFYGYGFGNAYRKVDYAFSAIVRDYPGAESVDQIGSTIWYNGIPTIRQKTHYVMDQGLGGIMIWSLNEDAEGKRSLLEAIHSVTAGEAPATRKS